MRAFAELLDRLSFTPARNGKLRLLGDYFLSVPDPRRGWALAALTGGLDFKAAKPAQVRALVSERVDPVLFGWSYDYVGDLAETTALIWPTGPEAGGEAVDPPPLDEVVERLTAADRDEVQAVLAAWLDRLDATGRWALLKFVMGGLRVGVSARLAKTALVAVAEANGQEVTLAEIEEVWHGLAPPYEDLFAWLEGRAERPRVDARAAFRPLMLAQPLEEAEIEKLDPRDFFVEWKWDGIRVQLAAGGGSRRLFSRSGDEIGGAFPDLLEAASFDAVLDGELLVARPGTEPVEIAPFNDLQQRLNRKSVPAKLRETYPAHLRIYDILYSESLDLRDKPLIERRKHLEGWYLRVRPQAMDLSPVLELGGWPDLKSLREEARERGMEGLMLKRKDSLYVAGRPKGPWFKWKRDALTLDAVLMYAQRGHGKRSSFYSDYTFGAWRPGEDGRPELVPVGKAYFGFTDEELRRLDKWVRDNTVERFGPVRAVRPGLVLEVAFDAVHRSGRHKSGLAMRFPRVHRIRWEKPAEEADRLETLARMIDE